jgi:hypothetical protein
MGMARKEKSENRTGMNIGCGKGGIDNRFENMAPVLFMMRVT